MDLEGAARRAAETVRSLPRGARWFLAADADADGLAAAAVMALALRRAGHAFQVRCSRDKDAPAYRALADVECDGYIVLDKGSSHLDVLDAVADATGRPMLVIDHHNVDGDIPDGVRLVNPRRLGLDGSRDACASTTAAAVALALDARNLDLAGIALAGAIGDWQHRDGWQGWNADLWRRALDAGHTATRTLPALVGIDLVDAFTHTRPPTPGLQDDPEAARSFLRSLGIEEVRDVDELDDDAIATLLSAWTLQHLQAGTEPTALDALTWDVWWDRRTGLGLRRLFRLLDACGRSNAAGTGLAWLLGDESARTDVESCFTEYADRLRAAMEHLHAHGSDTRRAMQVVWTDDPRLTGMVGGIGMTHILEDSRPAVILAKRPDGQVQVSTRGTHEQVEAGMDLGAAMQHAAAEVGREGGGHPIASGTVVARDDVDALLDALDAALVQQGFRA